MVKSDHTPKQPPLSPRKKRVFRIVLFLLPVALLAILELMLRCVKYGGNLDLLISAPEKVSNYKMCNRNVGRRFFYMLQGALPGVPKDLILKKKPENGYRIFVLGESTAAGFPYGNNVMFSRILNRRLADAFPERHIEVMNTAMTAINSYALLDFMDEILAHEPDAILIYSGHNEFYGAMGVASMESVGKYRWVVNTFLKLARFRTFLLVRDFVGQFRRLMIGKRVPEGSATAHAETLMERIVADQTIVYGSRLYQLGKRQFEANLRAIYKKAKDRGVPVLVSELVSNIRDQAPFVSQSTDTLPSALEVYRLAQSLEAEKKYDDAKRAYERAKDLDVLRFRAPEEFNEIIHRVADEFSAPVVPMKRYFEKASPNGLVGDNLMTDHLHPNIEGYFLMADAFFDAMHDNRFIADTWDLTTVKPDSVYPREWGLSKLDTVYAELGIRILKGGWPFQPKFVPNRVLQAFHPQNEIDSMAVAVLMNKLTLESAHLELAIRYARQGLYPLVFKEYKALYHIIPSEIVFYERAAEALRRMNRFDEALSILFQARKVRETGTVNKMIGLILLQDGMLDQAIPYLEKALMSLPNEALLIQNLGAAYLKTGRVAEGRKLLVQLRQTHP